MKNSEIRRQLAAGPLPCEANVAVPKFKIIRTGIYASHGQRDYTQSARLIRWDTQELASVKARKTNCGG